MPMIEIRDVRIHYELSGDESLPILVLGNSLGSNLHMWDKVLPRLEEQHHVLRYDMRGHGGSSVPAGPYTLDQLGSDVFSLLDFLGMDRVDFCGLSMGGQVAMWLSIHAPKRVNRIVLANTGARILTPEMWDLRIAAVRQNGIGVLAAATLERWFTPQYREQHPDEMSFIQAMIASTNTAGYCACCSALRDVDLRTEIHSIATPALVITGTRDPATPPSDGRAICSALPNSEYLELDSSHLSAWERADEFANAVLAFLNTGGRANG
jgi:3-oxoadipate enol-lactonase